MQAAPPDDLHRSAHGDVDASPTAQGGGDPAPYAWLCPPTDDEKHLWLRSGQHRWLFWAQGVAYGGVAYSFYGLARNSYWTLLFLIPLAIFASEQLLTLRTSTHKRRVTLPDHLFAVETWNPDTAPSIDVFITTCNEDPRLIENTLRYATQMRYAGPLEIYVLDDGGSAEVKSAASAYGVRYIARPGSEFKKAGNLQYAFERTSGDHILILDADYAVHPDFMNEVVPYLDDATVGIVQTPQSQPTGKGMSWLERCAGATQEIFYRFIQPSRDAVGATICCGGGAVYRRSGLEAIGGFPLIGTSEDVHTGLRMARIGLRVLYVPVLVSKCASPDEFDSFASQQYRWCEGSMTLLTDAEFHADATMGLAARACYWSGFLFYVSTALNALLAPVGVLIMVLFYPDRVRAANMYPLLPALLLLLVVFPFIATTRWRIDVLRVQAIYSFAHLFCIIDVLRGKMSEWIPTNAKVQTSVGKRVRHAMTWYIGITQPLIAVGLLHGVLRYGIAQYWLVVAAALLNFYCMVPPAWLALRTTLHNRAEARLAATHPAALPAAGAPAETQAALGRHHVLEGNLA
jgi:cellulose synthase (UDP-forming)